MGERGDRAQGASRDENRAIADRLRDYAGLLEQQGEDGFRMRAYRNAADEIDRLDEPLGAIHARGGAEALIALPAIGRGVAAAIVEMLETGRWGQLDRLRGEATPEALFRTLPGVGPKLAARLAETLDVETLEELETALREGETRAPGIGPRRRAALLAVLSDRLGRVRRAADPGDPAHEPPVALLLEADRLYREQADAGRLRRIAPRRLNPGGEAWLPIMHARRGGWHVTALFSNTPLAHKLGRTRDWVVIYFHEDHGPERRRTVVTERRGALAGRRVVRGLEAECAAHYAETGAA